MKQILAILTFLLFLLLVITTVMAVGNVHQSEQLALRTQQVSSLRAEVLSLQKENQQLDQQMHKAQSAMQTSRAQSSALLKRFDQLTKILRLEPVFARRAALTGSPEIRLPANGEILLRAGAMEAVLRRFQQQCASPDKLIAALSQNKPVPEASHWPSEPDMHALQEALQAAGVNASAAETMDPVKAALAAMAAASSPPTPDLSKTDSHKAEADISEMHTDALFGDGISTLAPTASAASTPLPSTLPTSTPAPSAAPTSLAAAANTTISTPHQTLTATNKPAITPPTSTPAPSAAPTSLSISASTPTVPGLSFPAGMPKLSQFLPSSVTDRLQWVRQMMLQTQQALRRLGNDLLTGETQEE